MKKIILFLFLCSLQLQAQDRIAQQTCSAVKEVTENFSQGQTEQWRKASYEITSASDVAERTLVTFLSGNSITLTDGFHASAGSSFKGIIGDCAQGKSESTAKLVASPNPSSNIVNLSVSDDPITRVVLVATDGKTVLDQTITSAADYRLDISSYPKGVYLLAVETSSGNKHTEKIIAQ